MPNYIIIIDRCPNCETPIHIESKSPRQELAQCPGCDGTFENSLADHQLAAIEETLDTSFADIPTSNITITIKMGEITIPAYHTLQNLERGTQ